MGEPINLVWVQGALFGVRRAMEEAQALLPPEIVGEREKIAGYSPAAFAKVESWYGTQPDRDQKVWDTLTDLKLLAEAAACLTTIVKSRERADVKPNLRLAKQRETS